MRPFGEVVATPFEVFHTAQSLEELVQRLKRLKGETRIIMEYTGKYFQPIAYQLYEAGLFVSVVNAILVHDFGNNSIRKVKTDKADAIKIANYGLTNWLDLPKYIPDENIRQMLKVWSRQYNQYIKQKTALKNNLISLLDQTFPGLNTLFKSKPRERDGHEKWLDFAASFWHCECICKLTPKAFVERYHKWCKKTGYYFNKAKADDIYVESCGHIGILPKNNCTKLLITQAVVQIDSISETLAVVSKEMRRLA